MQSYNWKQIARDLLLALAVGVAVTAAARKLEWIDGALNVLLTGAALTILFATAFRLLWKAYRHETPSQSHQPVRRIDDAMSRKIDPLGASQEAKAPAPEHPPGPQGDQHMTIKDKSSDLPKLASASNRDDEMPLQAKRDAPGPQISPLPPGPKRIDALGSDARMPLEGPKRPHVHISPEPEKPIPQHRPERVELPPSLIIQPARRPGESEAMRKQLIKALQDQLLPTGGKPHPSADQLKALLEQLRTSSSDELDALLARILREKPVPPRATRPDRAITPPSDQLFTSPDPPAQLTKHQPPLSVVKLRALTEYGDMAAESYVADRTGGGGRGAGKAPIYDPADIPLLAATAAPPPAADAVPERVNCSVFSPPSAPPDNQFLVQVFVYPPFLRGQVEALAKSFDETSSPRGFKVLQQLIRRGERLSFYLRMPGMEITEPMESLLWQGEAESVQFAVRVPANTPPGQALGKITVFLDSLPVGVIRFTLQITPPQWEVSAPALTGHDTRSFKRAFISYASDDEGKVLPRVQTLQRAGIDCFQDILHLKPGERWERQLYKKIDECDLFLLFWSNAAKASEWVMKETRYALARKGGDDYAPPELVPIPIEGPPPVAPPPDLAHLHFNDPLLYFMAER